MSFVMGVRVNLNQRVCGPPSGCVTSRGRTLIASLLPSDQLTSVSHKPTTWGGFVPLATTGIPASGVFAILFVIILIGIAMGYGSWASSIAKRKNRSPRGFFALGFFFGLIGVFIAAVMSSKPGPPPGV